MHHFKPRSTYLAFKINARYLLNLLLSCPTISVKYLNGRIVKLESIITIIQIHLVTCECSHKSLKDPILMKSCFEIIEKKGFKAYLEKRKRLVVVENA